ncbi:MAG: hypothetical protein RI906_2211 [Pseudomonadota bacterium]|jgi:2-methylcitrate dehydratase PrpD
MYSSGQASLVEHYARYAIAERARPLSPTVVHHARRALVDWFAAFVPGAVIAPATLLERALLEDLDHGEARLITGRRATLRAAALINGTASHTVEFDDIFRDAGFHPGSPIISAALAAAQTLDADGQSLLRAIVVGYEISARIGMAVMPSHYRYWHTTGTVGAFGAAAAVADLLGCDAPQFAHALATAGTFAAGLQQAFRSEAMSKPFHSGHAAEVGARAAMAAHVGITGALDLLEGEAGFGAAMSNEADWSGATADLGERYCITEMTFKNHGCCGHNFAPIDGVLQLRQAHGLAPDDIESIDIATYQAGVAVVDNPRPEGAYQAKFSVQYTVAHAVVHGSVRLGAFRAESLADSRVRALMARIRVSADPALSKAYPAQRAANIVVHTRTGKRFEHFQPTRKGDPDMPLSDAELQSKFDELVVPVLGPEKSTALARVSWSLGAQSVRSLDYFVDQRAVV